MNLWKNWELCETFSLDNAALLIAGCLPEEYPYAIQNWQIHEWPDGVYAIHTALKTAVAAGKLKATIKHRATEDGYLVEYEEGWEALSSQEIQDYNAQCKDPFGMIPPKYYYQSEMDCSETTISKVDLKAWLLSGKFHSTFFTPELKPEPAPWETEPFISSRKRTVGYLDTQHPYFSSKLKAAIDVWEAVSNDPPKSSSPKEAIKDWLREHAKSYDLLKDDETLNETAIEEIAKIVHWRSKGGAIKTPDLDSSKPPF